MAPFEEAEEVKSFVRPFAKAAAQLSVVLSFVVLCSFVTQLCWNHLAQAYPRYEMPKVAWLDVFCAYWILRSGFGALFHRGDDGR